jgi:hypothetical protein
MRTCSEKISPHHDEEGVYLLPSKKRATSRKKYLTKYAKYAKEIFPVKFRE